MKLCLDLNSFLYFYDEMPTLDNTIKRSASAVKFALAKLP